MHNALSVNRNCIQRQAGCNGYIKNRRREQLRWARARFAHARLVRVLVRVAPRVNSRNQAASRLLAYMYTRFAAYAAD